MKKPIKVCRVIGRIGRCNRQIAHNDELCGFHWTRKYGHRFRYYNGGWAVSRMCEQCGAKEKFYGELSFGPCPNAQGKQITYVLGPELTLSAAIFAKPQATLVDQLLHWQARAKIAERELERLRKKEQQDRVGDWEYQTLRGWFPKVPELKEWLSEIKGPPLNAS